MLTQKEQNIQDGNLEGTKHRNSMIQIGEAKFQGTQGQHDTDWRGEVLGGDVTEHAGLKLLKYGIRNHQS